MQGPTPPTDRALPPIHVDTPMPRRGGPLPQGHDHRVSPPLATRAVTALEASDVRDFLLSLELRTFMGRPTDHPLDVARKLPAAIRGPAMALLALHHPQFSQEAPADTPPLECDLLPPDQRIEKLWDLAPGRFAVYRLPSHPRIPKLVKHQLNFADREDYFLIQCSSQQDPGDPLFWQVLETKLRACWLFDSKEIINGIATHTIGEVEALLAQRPNPDAADRVEALCETLLQIDVELKELADRLREPLPNISQHAGDDKPAPVTPFKREDG